MRQRNIKNLEERLELNSTYLVRNPKDWKGRWRQVFGNDNPIYLEIGCGKGQFINRKAMLNPQINYIAIEGQSNVVLRAMEKAQDAGLGNLRIFITFVNDLEDYFEKGELTGIYLNFSDPWPKARHAKRRLTYRERLLNYKKVLCNGGAIEFKTDNDSLFEFTLEEVEAAGLSIEEMTRDLHQSLYDAKTVKTEYEEKFSAKGKNINYIKIK